MLDFFKKWLKPEPRVFHASYHSYPEFISKCEADKAAFRVLGTKPRIGDYIVFKEHRLRALSLYQITEVRGWRTKFKNHEPNAYVVVLNYMKMVHSLNYNEVSKSLKKRD